MTDLHHVHGVIITMRPNNPVIMQQMLTWYFASAALHYGRQAGLKTWFPWVLPQHYCYQAMELGDPQQALDLLECRRWGQFASNISLAACSSTLHAQQHPLNR